MGKGIMGAKDRRKKKKKRKVLSKQVLQELVDDFKVSHPDDTLDSLLSSVERAMQTDSKFNGTVQQFLRDSMNDITPRTPLWVVEQRAKYLIAACLPIMSSSEVIVSRAKYWMETNASEIAKANSDEIEASGGSLVGYQRKSMEKKDSSSGAPKAKKKNGGQGIGDAIMGKLKTSPNLSFEDAQAMALEVNPDSKFSKASFNWYKNKVKKES